MASSSAGWVLQAALQAAAGVSAKEFVPATRFSGAKPGYFFKNGEHGLGYYSDPLQQQGGGEGGADGDAGGGAGPSGSNAGEGDDRRGQQQLDPEELLRQAEEEANIDQIQALDAKSLRRLVAGLDKKYKENLALRLKYADQPDRFLDSEVDLDEHIKSLMQVAGSPDLYPVLVDGPCVPTLLSLLSHENTDIAADVVELLAEMTGADAAEEFGEEARALVDCLVEHNGVELLVQRLLSLNEGVEEEARAVHNCLAVFENVVEINPELSSVLVDKTRLLKWLLSRLKRRDFDANKQYASELLAILMQGSVSNQARLGDAGGIDLLLTCVAQYKSKDPAPGEEEEYMQNCFDVLCACLMQPQHKQAFVKAEGVELMHLMLQSRRQCRYGALKCLDYAATRFAAPAERLVDLGGLKQLFGLFMGKAKVKGPTGEHDVDTEVEERCVSLVGSLMMHLPDRGAAAAAGGGGGAAARAAARRERLLAKFVENEFEKTDRLMELLFRYQARVKAEERRLAAALADEDQQQQQQDTDDEELLLARMDAGLFTLQQCCVVVGGLWGAGDAGLRRRILTLLHQKGQTLGPIREVLLEYYNSIGTEGGEEEAARQRALVRGLLVGLGAELEEEVVEEANTQQQQAKTHQQQQQGGSRDAGAKGRGEQEEDGMDMEVDGEGGAAEEGEARPPMPPPPPQSAQHGKANGDRSRGQDDRDRGASGRRRGDADAMPPPPPPANGSRAAPPPLPPPPATEASGRHDRGGEEGSSRADRGGGRRRSRSRSRSRSPAAGDAKRRRSRSRSRSPARGGGGGSSKQATKDKDKDRERDRERERDKERSGKDRDRDREREKDRDKDRSRDKERDRDRDRDRERDERRDKERDRDRDRERDRDSRRR